MLFCMSLGIGCRSSSAFLVRFHWGGRSTKSIPPTSQLHDAREAAAIVLLTISLSRRSFFYSLGYKESAFLFLQRVEVS